MEQDFGSEYSSASESGWTMYLGHSIYPYDPLQKPKNDEDDDDMSMVSDASSGPPHVQEQECNNNGGKEAGADLQRKIQDFPCFLDDTATSSLFNFYVGNGQVAVGEGDNFVEDYSEGESRFQDEFGHFSSCLSGTRCSKKP